MSCDFKDVTGVDVIHHWTFFWLIPKLLVPKMSEASCFIEPWNSIFFDAKKNGVSWQRFFVAPLLGGEDYFTAKYPSYIWLSNFSGSGYCVWALVVSEAWTRKPWNSKCFWRNSPPRCPDVYDMGYVWQKGALVVRFVSFQKLLLIDVHSIEATWCRNLIVVSSVNVLKYQMMLPVKGRTSF